MGDSAARLGIAIGGAVISTALGVGPGVGFAAGSLLGGFLFPGEGQSTVAEGPRLGDLAVTSSAYGAPLGIGFGTVRRGGNIIWATPIEEQRNVRKEESGGKGLPGPKNSATQITYSYFGNFAVSFGEGIIEDVLRLWADGKLIYDKTGESSSLPKIDEDGNFVTEGIAAALGLNYDKEGLRFRLYRGTETQLPDPLILADKGASATPAFRGQAYIVFDRIPLQDYGNRIPSITAELTYKSITIRPEVTADLFTVAEGGIASNLAVNIVGFDWERGFAYIPSGDGTVVRRINLRTMKEDRQSKLEGSVTTVGGPYSVMYDGSIIGNSGSSNSRPIHRIDPNTLQVVSTFGSGGTGLTNTASRFVALRACAPVRALGPDGPTDFVFTFSVFGAVGLLKIQESGDLQYIWGAGQGQGEGVICPGAVNPAVGDGWLVTDAKTVWRLRAHWAAAPDTLPGVDHGVDFDQFGSLTTGTGTVASVYFDAVDETLIVVWSADEVVKYDPATQAEIWTRTIPGLAGDDKSGAQSVVRDQRLGLVAGDTTFVLDTATGELVDETSGWSPAASGEQAYNSRVHCIFVRIGSSGVAQLFLQRGGGQGEELSNIVSSICQRTGLEASDLDVTELTDVVPGYQLGRPSTARAALTPLSTAYFFDGIESDFKLTFPKRGKAKVLDIPQDDLGVVDAQTGELLPETRVQEVELPVSIELLYLDRDNDHQQDIQRDKRVALPSPAMHSSNAVKLELPITMQAATARDIVERRLYSAWLERVSYRLLAGWRHMKLNPGDTVDVVMDNGDRFPVRLTQVDINGNLSLSMEGVAADAAVLSGSGAAADRGAKVPQVLTAPSFTRLFLPNVPLLRDVDDTGRTASRVYFMMGGQGQPGWIGAVLYRSSDGQDYSQIGQGVDEVTYGSLQNKLGDTAQPFVTDTVNTIRVSLSTNIDDGLSSVTNLQMLNGANACLVGSTANGYEVVQFQNATQQADGSWVLDTLLRGRRGTENLTGSHLTGDDFILLSTSTAEAFLSDLSVVGLSRFFKSVGYGLIFEDVLATTRIHTGEDLKPYAPVHLAGVVDGGSNIDISWVRRTRVGGDEFPDGTGDVPLNEDSESYEVDIRDAGDTTVLRTLASSVESVQYDNADIITDFGSVPSTLNVEIFQISAQVGRGQRAKATLVL